LRSKSERIDHYDSYGASWENLKTVIKQAAIDFGISKRKALLRERNFLTRKIIRAKNPLCQGDQNVSLEIKELENALSSLVIREAEGAKIRSRAKRFEEGEKPTRFFFRLEQKMASKNLLRLILSRF